MLAHKQGIADEVIKTLWHNHPEYNEIFSSEAKEKCRDDIQYHILYLAEAAENNSLALFSKYIHWVKVLFHSYNVPIESLLESLRVIQEVVSHTLETESLSLVQPILEETINEFPSLALEHPSPLGPDNPHRVLAQQYLEALITGDRNRASTLVFDAIDKGTPIREIYLHVFQAVQIEMGRLWQLNKVSVAQEHFTTAATQLIMSRLYPYIFSQEKTGHVFVGGCVGDELHELGVRMISDFFELEGWDTYFLGANTPTEAIVSMLKEKKAHLIGIGVTISFHLSRVKEIIAAIRNDSDLDYVKILVGGYAFNQDTELWKKVRADGWAPNAVEAVKVGNALVEKQ
jgi:methanogenic corrinoid protein MtbC1